MKYKVLSIDLDWLQSHFHLKNLNALFFDKVKTAKRIVFSKHHHTILNELHDKNNISLHNIDHHHDICYQESQQTCITEGRATYACWVGYLIYSKKLNEHYWYKNGDSSVLDPEQSHNSSQYFFTNIIIHNELPYHVVEDLTHAQSVDTYDLMFVCSSQEYSNIQYSVVYDIYKDMCNDYYKFKTFEIQLTPDLPNTPLWFNK